ncbi:MAG: hypothetical protein QNK04_26575 [Myxococcota bacterium]|nr:hypothetical protein [Myxococcota bacterium]
MAAAEHDGAAPPGGPPPLRPFGLVLHHDGSWSHEGVPVLNRRLRRAFDKSVRFLPEEGEDGVYVVQLGRFRGQIEVEEAGFFVRDFDAASASVGLSDGSREAFEPASLGVSERDGALLCRVKSDLREGGLLARFGQAAQAELLLAVEDTSQGPRLRLAGVLHAIPEI